jgi:hypothetical protein
MLQFHDSLRYSTRDNSVATLQSVCRQQERIYVVQPPEDLTQLTIYNIHPLDTLYGCLPLLAVFSLKMTLAGVNYIRKSQKNLKVA